MQEISALDIHYLLEEFKILKNAILQKIYHIPELEMLKLVFYVKDEGEKTLVILPNAIYLTSYKIENPLYPSNFCLFLRKYLLRKKLLEIKQINFERILEFIFPDYILIVEVFSKGNVILCDDNYKIISPLKIQIWKDRTIRKGETYKTPPLKKEIRHISSSDFISLYNKTKGNIISFLATEFNFGKKYANEIFLRANIERKEELEEKEIVKLYEKANALFLQEKKPLLYFENNKKFDFSPFPLLFYKNKPFEEFSYFSEAIDEFFKENIEVSFEKEEKKEEEKKEKIIEIQKENIEKLKEKEVEAREIANLLNKNFLQIEELLLKLKRAREIYSWDKIKEFLEKEDSYEASLIKEIREKEGILVLNLEGKEVKIDFTKSLEENIQEYFEKAKKAKKKVEGAKKAIEEIEKKEIAIKRKPKIEKIKKDKKRWYEKFRHFFTSDNFLVVMGKDAQTNELLIKKYMEKEDIVLHAEIIGSPFALIKSEGKEISNEAIKEASEFVACYSKAWQMNLGSIAVYWVYPEQVSKNPPAGQYLPKGSFMIYGEKHYLKKVGLKLGIGVKIEEDKNLKVISLPLQAARKHCNYFVTIVPGIIPALDLARKIKQKLIEKSNFEHREIIEKVNLESIRQLIPFGKGDLIEY